MMEARQRLQRAGLRVTAQRIAVLDALDAHPHGTARLITAKAQQRLGSVSAQAVYDALTACANVGLVRRIDIGGGFSLYETRVGDNHHHLYCRRCGRVHDVDCVVGARPCLTPADDAGFVVDEAEVVFRGLCPDCQTAAIDHQSHEAARSHAAC
jgi:Fur family ferric uptake transcriptional regulator